MNFNAEINNIKSQLKRLCCQVGDIDGGDFILNQGTSAQDASFWIDGTGKIAEVETSLIAAKNNWNDLDNLVISPTVEHWGDTYFTSTGKVGIGRPTTLSRLHVHGTGNQFAISQDDTTVNIGQTNVPVASMTMRILSTGQVGTTISGPGVLSNPGFFYSHLLSAPKLLIAATDNTIDTAQVTGSLIVNGDSTIKFRDQNNYIFQGSNVFQWYSSNATIRMRQDASLPVAISLVGSSSYFEVNNGSVPLLQVDRDNQVIKVYGKLNLVSPLTPSSSADVTGTEGDIARDDNYIYVKTSTGWKRSALSTF